MTIDCGADAAFAKLVLNEVRAMLRVCMPLVCMPRHHTCMPRVPTPRVPWQLHELDVFVRMPGVAPLDRCIRVSCGMDAELDAFEKALPAALEAARRRSSLII